MSSVSEHSNMPKSKQTPEYADDPIEDSAWTLVKPLKEAPKLKKVYHRPPQVIPADPILPKVYPGQPAFNLSVGTPLWLTLASFIGMTSRAVRCRRPGTDPAVPLADGDKITRYVVEILLRGCSAPYQCWMSEERYLAMQLKVASWIEL